jgi:hypothetical protein
MCGTLKTVEAAGRSKEVEDGQIEADFVVLERC